MDPSDIRSVCEHFDLDYHEGRTTVADVATALGAPFDSAEDTLATIVARCYLPRESTLQRSCGDVPLVSVIVPCRPGEKLTVIESLRDQTHRRLELHVIIDYYGEGAAATRNRGAALARGEYLLFCDADINLVPDAIEMMLRSLETNASADWVFGRAVVDGRDVTGQKPASPPLDTESPEFIWYFNGIHTASLVRSRVSPSFDPRMLRFSDWDLWVRLVKAGHRSLFLDRIILRSENRPNCISTGEHGGWFKWQRVLFRKHGSYEAIPKPSQR